MTEIENDLTEYIVDSIKTNFEHPKIPITCGDYPPKYSHDTDAGADIYASETVIIHPGETKIVSTGVCIELPIGFEAQIRPRSGITAKTALRVHLGTIDSGYRDELKVICTNDARPNFSNVSDKPGPYKVNGMPYKGDVDFGLFNSEQSVIIEPGDRIAQLVISPCVRAEFVPVDELDDSLNRGGGLGSTGVE